ncbi:MAG: PIN domain-containing protein [Anaerolineae bacterium]
MDTNIISLLLRENANVVARMDVVTNEQNRFIGCPTVWYEVRRGLLTRDAKKQAAKFEALFNIFEWQDYATDDWKLASELWARRVLMGRPVSDADLLIAVFAINRDAVLVTDNEKDFAELGAKVENWKISNDID